MMGFSGPCRTQAGELPQSITAPIGRAVLLMLCFLFPFMPRGARAEEILVSAAASLTDVLKEIRAGYRAEPMYEVKFNLGPSSALARQIEEGAPVDLFFSADLAQMDKLDRNGRLEPGTRKNLLSNQLVIIAPADSKLIIGSPHDLLQSTVKRLALADPDAVPAGVYSRRFLTDEGLWQKIKNRIVRVQDVRATLAAVESGNVEAGFVYKTDAAVSARVKVLYPVPAERAPRILYPVAIIRQSKRKVAARDFLNHLQAPAAKYIFRKHGFVVLH